MELKVLGSWAPYPAPGQACSGYLLSSAGRRILIDIGHGSFSKLQAVSDFGLLDAVFVSHLHADHSADLACLRHAVLVGMRRGTRSRRLPVILPEGPEEKFQLIEDYADAFEIHAIDTSLKCDTFDIAGLEFSVLKMEHPIPTYGFCLEDGGKRFVYSSDTAWKDEVIKFANSATLFLCEASLVEEDASLAEKGHLTARGAGELALRAGAKKLVLTHFLPEYDLNIIEREAKDTFSGAVELACEFGVYSC